MCLNPDFQGLCYSALVKAQKFCGVWKSFDWIQNGLDYLGCILSMKKQLNKTLFVNNVLAAKVNSPAL